ncbi:hypothetical protein [Sphingomonas cavernae]|nr:hypothetical protein [Sphingomonas cavernae]
MTAKFENLQRATLSVLGALMLATVFVGTAVVPAEAVTAAQPTR